MIALSSAAVGGVVVVMILVVSGLRRVIMIQSNGGNLDNAREKKLISSINLKLRDAGPA